MRIRQSLALGLLLAAAAFAGHGAADLRAGQQPAPFPHDKHAKVFPTCSGCHDGIATGDSAKMFPAPLACAQCHDGQDLKRVAWSGPTPRATNLAFSHGDHLVKSAATDSTRSPDCLGCHAPATLGPPSADQMAAASIQRDTAWMHVARPIPEVCFACHGSPAAHLADTSPCATCHVPVTRALALTPAQIASFPKALSHSRADFASEHVPPASNPAQCATCHARESCARCHPNASRVAAITQLASDARIAGLVRDKLPAYPTPASHTAANWGSTHGAEATRQIQSCANCHAQPSCRSCHTGQGASSVIARLPVPAPGAGPGVKLVAASTGRLTSVPGGVRVHPTDWVKTHPAAAASGQAACMSCHQQSECAACHGGNGQAGGPTAVHVHPSGWTNTHAASAASGRMTCTACHEQRECTACHDGNGAGPRRYHASDFIARHATPAFNTDVDCSSCHRAETFCRACHLSTRTTSGSASKGAAHTAQPLWLLQHGQAARQSLTSCTTCHQQTDCLRCHSSQGLHVNPHGPNFDASKMSSRNRQMCLICHLSDPLSKNP